jgi:hypothetical protein
MGNDNYHRYDTYHHDDVRRDDHRRDERRDDRREGYYRDNYPRDNSRRDNYRGDNYRGDNYRGDNYRRSDKTWNKDSDKNKSFRKPEHFVHEDRRDKMRANTSKLAPVAAAAVAETSTTNANA